VGKHHSIRQPTPRAAKGKARAVSRAMSVGRLLSTPAGRRRVLAKSASLSAVQSEPWKGHVFEVYKASKEQPLVGDEESVKGLVLPTGKLWRKLSSVRERHIFRDLYGATDSVKQDEAEDSDEEDEWAWEAEDDFTLGHLWPNGPSLRRAIIYRHNAHIAIHITIHRGSIPHRKGVGNLPFVFFSQGLAGDTIKISHDIHSHRKAADTPADDDDDLPSLPSSIATTATQINRWNALGTFTKFLKYEDERERRLRGHASLPDSENTEPSSKGSLPRSDDIPFPSSDGESDSDYSACSDSVLFPFASSAITPYPAHPAHRKRVQSAERRLERLTRSGLHKSQLSDEEDEEEVRKKRSERAPSVEIPEGVVKESNSPDDFNPFGDDEVEI